MLVHRYARIRGVIAMKTDTASNFRLGWHLAKAELANRNAASFGGVFWTFFTPVATILTIWIALDYGLGMRASAGPGYGQALVAAMVVWLFLSEAIVNGSLAIRSNPHFVKKIKFPVGLLPASSVLAALVTHLVILTAVIGLLISQGVSPGWPMLTLPLWIALAAAIALSLALLTSALTVVIPDAAAILPSVIGLLFWLTPIVWPMSIVPEPYRWVVLLNPMAIVVEGYRYALTGKPIELGVLTYGAAAAITVLTAVLAIAFFRRVRPLFADML